MKILLVSGDNACIEKLIQNTDENLEFNIAYTGLEALNKVTGNDSIAIDLNIEDMLWNVLVENVRGKIQKVFILTDNPNIDIWEKASIYNAVVLSRENYLEELKPYYGNNNIIQSGQRPIATGKLQFQPLSRNQEEIQSSSSVVNNQNITRVNNNPINMPDIFNINNIKRSTQSAAQVVLRQQVIVIHSPKGGVGKTTTAVNLTAALANNKAVKLNVCLVDFDLRFGNVASHLGIDPTSTILDFDGSLEGLNNCLIDHPDGFKVMLAPINPVDKEAVTPELVDKVLSVLSKRFDIVVVDTSPDLDDAAIVAFDWATKIFEIATAEKPTLADVYKMRKVFDDLKIPLDKVGLILNRIPKRPSFRIADITEAIKIPIIATIAEDPAVQTVMNRGELPAVSRRSRGYAAALLKVANNIVPSISIGESFLSKLAFWR